MSGLGSGLSLLFKRWGKGIGNAVDNFLLDADARKAINDEVRNKFQPRIDLARAAESKRAANIKELDKKLNDSKQAFQDAQTDWQKKYDSALATAKNQRQTDINDYDTKLQGYQDALNNASKDKQDIWNQLVANEARYTKNKTIFTDVETGKNYIYDPVKSNYIDLDTYYKSLTKKGKRAFDESVRDYETRLFDKDSLKLINAFDDNARLAYKDQNDIFDSYLKNVEGQNAALIRNLRDADRQITKANNDLTAWQRNTRPSAWDDKTDLSTFETDFKKNNASPSKYNFNGQTYKSKKALNQAYQDALDREQRMQSLDSGRASRYASKRDAEIAQRIQDAKDIKKAKLALGAGAGAGALFAGARALYGGDDTDTTDTTDNIDNTDNIDTYTGEPDPDLKLENTPEGKTAYTGKLLVDTGFDPDKAEAEAVLAGAAYDKGVEDGNAIRSSGDLGNNIAATTGGHTIDDGLYELLKNMKDPYKADAIANYIYSRHGDDPEVQNLGWRGWLNKYYGDSLRSIMNIDPSGYKGMHISGGL